MDTQGNDDSNESGCPSLVIGIGASAGGLEALRELFASLPPDAGMAFIVVQHSDPRHAAMLSEILQPISTVPIELAKDGQRIRRDHAYTAPADQDLVVEDGILRLVPRTLTRRIHLPVDTLFCSLAQAYESKAIGIVLSGTGNDGTIGLQDIKMAGGIAIAQDGQSARHSGMPKSAISAGHVDHILSPSNIAAELARIASMEENSTVRTGDEDRAALKEILSQLKTSFGVDFADYKETTVSRRVRKRVTSSKLKTLVEYLAFVKTRPDELEALYGDILINVTSFFRDPEMFDALEALIIPKITEGRGAEDSLRVWVPGCSSGEEVYSLAIRLAEFNEKYHHSFSAQFFGTDISEPALEKARSGIYPTTISSIVSPERLKKFFDPVQGGYQIKKEIRDTCVFARQNVIADPPLSRMDLISCRNLLIYFGPALQERVVPIFHYALKVPNGFLILGKSELVDVFSDYFIPIEKAHKFYQKKDIPLRLSYQPIPGHKFPVKVESLKPQPSIPPARDSENDIHRETDRFILANFSPAAVVITENCDIVQFRGHTAAYLDPSGRASFNLFKMLHPDLMQPVRQAIEKAKSGEASFVKCNQLRFRSGDEFKHVNVRVTPLRTPTLKQRYFLIIFEESPASLPRPGLQKTEFKDTDGAEVVQVSESEEIRRLTEELEGTRQHLQAVIDERDIGFEELQSANEEVTSSNEELQTINQELETAKEELESSNEELTTLNEQLRHNMELLRKSEEHFRILVSGVKDYAIFMLDPAGRVLSWNDGAERIKGYSKNEIIGEHFSIFYPEEMKRAGKPNKELEVATKAGRFEEEGLRVRKDGATFWASVIITALYNEDGRLYGFAKITRDITERKQADEKLRQSELRFRRLISGVKDYAIFMLDPEGYVMSWNEGAERIKGYKAEEIVGQHFSKFYPKDDAYRTKHELEIAARTGTYEEEGWRIRKNGTRFWANVLITTVRDDAGQIIGFSKVTRDLTDKRNAQEALRASEARSRLVLEKAHDAFVAINDRGSITEWNPQAETTFGWSRQEAVGRSLCETIIPEKYHQAYRRGLENFVKSSEGPVLNRRLEFPALRKDGTEIPVELTVLPIKVDDSYSFTSFIRDISERKRAEALAASNAELQDFAFIASHDLKEPLRMVSTYLQFVEKRARSKLNDEEREFIDYACEGAQRMQALIEDLLSYARLGRAPQNTRPVDFNAVAAEAEANLRPAIRESEASLRIGLLPTLNADPVQMVQVFQNLLSNAIKYRSEKKLEIEITAEERQEGWMFSVKDNGIGISPEYAERIFLVFQRLHSDRTKYQGTGIGLAICKKIIERHRGRIWVESRSGEGASFHFILPGEHGIARNEAASST
ncbi:PAS domain S-box protein [Oligoflexus tunisiensis]|uniref:PAS domain S-box protein n=1 Tax=Oligoflexus tunisiensis TaxID=708132 RepID=UPI000AD23614|nr:PAS domain S-box protein [Oligoflexus tunisiensis]